MAGKNVVVIDDEAQIRKLFSDVLSQHGYTVTGVADGRDISTILKDTQADVVFLDLKMPDTDGVKVLESIRESHSAIPVVIITGYPRDSLVEGAIRLGVFACLVKPFSMADVMAILETLELLEAA